MDGWMDGWMDGGSEGGRKRKEEKDRPVKIREPLTEVRELRTLC